jgi:hypothetical protein
MGNVALVVFKAKTKTQRELGTHFGIQDEKILWGCRDSGLFSPCLSSLKTL